MLEVKLRQGVISSMFYKCRWGLTGFYPTKPSFLMHSFINRQAF